MMALVDALTDFKTETGVPVSYRFFREAQAPPFVCYYETSSDNFAADNRVFHRQTEKVVELYTDLKDPALEAAMEEALDDYIWTKEETYVDAEQMYLITYELEE